MNSKNKSGMFVVGERWRAIPFSTKYEISSNGAIRDAKTHKARASKGPIGYLRSDGKRRTMPVWKVYELVWPEEK
jgi:hypothetical protein